jgi:hypothetical protein
VKKGKESQKNGSGYISVEPLIHFPTSLENFCGLISGHHFWGRAWHVSMVGRDHDNRSRQSIKKIDGKEAQNLRKSRIFIVLWS